MKKPLIMLLCAVSIPSAALAASNAPVTRKVQTMTYCSASEYRTGFQQAWTLVIPCF
jgi:hypothetical protein